MALLLKVLQFDLCHIVTLLNHGSVENLCTIKGANGTSTIPPSLKKSPSSPSFPFSFLKDVSFEQAVWNSVHQWCHRQVRPRPLSLVAPPLVNICHTRRNLRSCTIFHISKMLRWEQWQIYGRHFARSGCPVSQHIYRRGGLFQTTQSSSPVLSVFKISFWKLSQNDGVLSFLKSSQSSWGYRLLLENTLSKWNGTFLNIQFACSDWPRWQRRN